MVGTIIKRDGQMRSRRRRDDVMMVPVRRMTSFSSSHRVLVPFIFYYDRLIFFLFPLGHAQSSWDKTSSSCCLAGLLACWPAGPFQSFNAHPSRHGAAAKQYRILDMSDIPDNMPFRYLRSPSLLGYRAPSVGGWPRKRHYSIVDLLQPATLRIKERTFQKTDTRHINSRDGTAGQNRDNSTVRFPATASSHVTRAGPCHATPRRPARRPAHLTRIYRNQKTSSQFRLGYIVSMYTIMAAKGKAKENDKKK